MIAYIKGKIINIGPGYIIVQTGDVGYQVHVNQALYDELEVGAEIELYTHQYVREDALDLYGFRSLDELEMFELLLSISGIGPKSALGVLAITGIDQLKEAIAQGDSSLLTKVSGVGKKTAERVVLELREKVSRLLPAGAKSGGVRVSGDEIDALMALGYSLSQAREALKQVDSGVKDSGERIRQALKKLGK